MQNPFMIGEKVYLRPVEPGDAGLVAACANDPEVRVSFFTHSPLSIDRARKRIEEYYGPGADYVPLAICPRDTNEAVGVTAFHRLDLVSHAAVFSICISDSRHWGKGYAREVTSMMLRYGFDVLNLHRIQLHVWTGNEAGIRAYEKAGFAREGLLREAMCHDGRYCDFLVMGVLEREWREKQPRESKSGA